MFDTIIVGGGPGGLQAALTLGRARRRVLVCDAGPRRNAAATHVHNFVTRDGTPPDEFRRIAREQLAAYPEVRFADEAVEAISGSRGAFRVQLASGTVDARRIVLATGMIDEPLPIEGFRELWGRSICQCPYCHGWEARDRRWGYLALPANAAHVGPFARMLRAWTDELTVFTDGAVDVGGDVGTLLRAAGIRVETGAIVRFVGGSGGLEAVELAGGVVVPCEVMFAHPPQRQVTLVRELGLALDPEGFVAVDPMRRETSIPGIYASGDLTTRGQAAVLAAATGMQAAAAINVDLAMEGV
jgi:thioredoxin reductase